MSEGPSLPHFLGLTATDWTAVSAITAALTGVVAILSALVLLRQLRLNSEISAQELGWRLWSEYLHTLISHPEVRDAGSVRAAAGVEELSWKPAADVQTSLTTRLLLNKYRSVIEVFLNAADGLLAGPRASAWGLEVREHARRYSPDLPTLWALEGWDRRFNKKLQAVIDELKSGSPTHA